jgi:hypothetical protein
MSRTLTALLSTDLTKKVANIVFVECDDQQANTAFLKYTNTLFVHEKWLDFWRAHQGFPCEVSDLSQAETEDFFCRHLAEELYKRAILAIAGVTDMSKPVMTSNTPPLQLPFRRSREKIREMPTMIRTTLGPLAGSLSVSWSDGYSLAFARKFGLQLEYLVVLHGLRCAERAYQLVYREAEDLCDCPHKLVAQSLNCAVFEALDGQSRFPMVVRRREGSIYGHPPAPVSPDTALNGRASSLSLRVEVDEMSDSSSGDSDAYNPDMWTSKDNLPTQKDSRGHPECFPDDVLPADADSDVNDTPGLRMDISKRASHRPEQPVSWSNPVAKAEVVAELENLSQKVRPNRTLDHGESDQETEREPKRRKISHTG